MGPLLNEGPVLAVETSRAPSSVLSVSLGNFRASVSCHLSWHSSQKADSSSIQLSISHVFAVQTVASHSVRVRPSEEELRVSLHGVALGKHAPAWLTLSVTSHQDKTTHSPLAVRLQYVLDSLDFQSMNTGK